MFSTLFFPLFPMDQVILKSWEEKSPHKRPILQMRKLRLRRIKFQPGFQAGLVDCRPLLSAGALFLPPGQAGLQSLHTPSPQCLRKGWRGPGGGRPSGGVPSTAHGVSGKAGVAPGAGAPKGVSQAQVPEGARESVPGSVHGWDSVSGVVCVWRAHLTGKTTVSFRP